MEKKSNEIKPLQVPDTAELEKLCKELKERYKNDPSAKFEDYAVEFPSDDGEETYQSVLISMALAQFRADHPDFRIRREVCSNEIGRGSSVRCELYKGPNPEDYMADGFGEAVAQGESSLPLATAARRALKDALRAAGYDIPCWVTYRTLMDAFIPGDTAELDAMEEKAEKQLAEEEKKKPAAAVNTTTVAAPEVSEETENAESAAEPAAVAVKHRRGRKSNAEKAAEAATQNTAASADAANGKSFWDSIPDNNLTNAQIAEYIGKVSEEEALAYKITFGLSAGRQIGELVNEGNGKSIRFYANSKRSEGTKLRLACLKVCETRGF